MPFRAWGSDGFQRGLIAASLTLGLVLVLVLGPAASRSHAASMFGTLRAPGEPALIAGHRGDRATAPENTLPSFESALAGPMTFVETDVRLSADGVPVLMHDATVDRTTDGAGAVAELTLAELKLLDAGTWYDTHFANTRIPTLDEFLDLLVDSRKKAMIELKGVWAVETVTIVDELIRAHGVESRIILASFEEETMMALQEAVELPRVLLCRELPPDAVATVSDFGAIALITNPDAIESRPEVVDELHKAGLGVLLYTLNKTRNWSEALALGVDGIITDKPSTLDGWLAESAPGT
ncbi:glycerophosphodiester phosphodiesterase [Homoserinimonas aerilata]|nr:glycerophosphodiester phosphodiesterase family protein [Homoserinimonas aerilata]